MKEFAILDKETEMRFVRPTGVWDLLSYCAVPKLLIYSVTRKVKYLK